jgi:adenylate cyclase
VPEEEKTLVALSHEIPVQYAVLEGKHLGENVFQGTLVKLSPNSAELCSEYPLELLSNLKLNLLTGTEKARGLGDIYAKVVEKSTHNQDHFCICFTAVPPEVAALLYYLRQGQGKGEK